MDKEFNINPVDVPAIHTPYRVIKTALPVPGSVEMLESLRRHEPKSMSGQPPIIWDRAEGFSVYDPYGNKWIDFSSGVLVANAGHAAPRVREAVAAAAAKGTLYSYCFPNAARAQLVERLASLAPDPLNRVFLLTTGSEAVENAIKVARMYGRTQDENKYAIVSYERGFHGRTLGSQMAGGIPELKEWVGGRVEGFYQVPFPDGFRTEDTTFDSFEASLAGQGVEPANVAAVIMETYQGGGASFAPVPYIEKLRAWCTKHGVLLVFDEVQAGFGRTGTFWGFEHYGVTPDLICCGKGIGSSLPISATIGPDYVMDLAEPGSMTSTHAAHALCCAAAVANVDTILDEAMVANSKVLGDHLHERLNALMAKHPEVIGAVHGKGLMAGVHFVKSGTKEPDSDLAFRVTEQCMYRGVMLFAPVGFGSATIKICPPLMIDRFALDEGLDAFADAVSASVCGS